MLNVVGIEELLLLLGILLGNLERRDIAENENRLDSNVRILVDNIRLGVVLIMQMDPPWRAGAFNETDKEQVDVFVHNWLLGKRRMTVVVLCPICLTLF